MARIRGDYSVKSEPLFGGDLARAYRHCGPSQIEILSASERGGDRHIAPLLPCV
jgi:hypothetical protein